MLIPALFGIMVAFALSAYAMTIGLDRDRAVSNPGVPSWWPPFCLTYDLTAAAFLAWSLRRSPALSKPRVAIPPWP